MFGTRIGFGYDVHAYSADRKLILCGIEVPHTKGLIGHSDADVALHSIIDALCGALALGDIGTHFPDTDKEFKNIDSAILFQKVWDIVVSRDWKLGNLDLSIICEKPKLLSHVPAMREKVSNLFDTTIENISIKATTSEKMGFVGREEGIACHSVVLLHR